MRRTIVTEFYNSGIIRSLFRGFPSSRKGFPRKLLSCACSIFLHPTGFRNKVLFPTSGIKALVRVVAMTGKDRKTSVIEKFDGTYFGYCKMQIEDYLYGNKLHLPLFGKKPDKMKDAKWALLDR